MKLITYATAATVLLVAHAKTIGGLRSSVDRDARAYGTADNENEHEHQHVPENNDDKVWYDVGVVGTAVDIEVEGSPFAMDDPFEVRWMELELGGDDGQYQDDVDDEEGDEDDYDKDEDIADDDDDDDDDDGEEEEDDINAYASYLLNLGADLDVSLSVDLEHHRTQDDADKDEDEEATVKRIEAALRKRRFGFGSHVNRGGDDVIENENQDRDQYQDGDHSNDDEDDNNKNKNDNADHTPKNVKIEEEEEETSENHRYHRMYQRAQRRAILEHPTTPATPQSVLEIPHKPLLHALEAETPPVDELGPLYFFLHLPKTAGQAFHRIFARSFSNCNIDDLMCKKKSKGKKHVGPRMDITYAYQGSTLKLFDYPEKVRGYYDKYQAGLGHVDSSFSVAMYPRSVLFISFLRDPMTRLKSMYRYMVGNSKVVVLCINRMRTGAFEWRDLKKDKHLRGSEQKAMLQKAKIVAKEASGLTENVMSVLNAETQKQELESCNDPMLKRRLYQMGESVENYERKQVQKLTRGLKRHSDGRPFMLGPNTLLANTTVGGFDDVVLKLGIDNYMTKALAGTTAATYIGTQHMLGLSNEDMLDMAKQQLLVMPFFGLTENFTESVEMFLWTFGFEGDQDSDGEKFRHNLSRKTEELPVVQEQWAKVEKHEQLDIDLYAYGLEIFNKRYAYMQEYKKAGRKDSVTHPLWGGAKVPARM